MSSAPQPSRLRNNVLVSHRKDAVIAWMKEMLSHSFVLASPDTYRDTMVHIESLFEEHSLNPATSTLKILIPSVGTFFTGLPITQAFDLYDAKYCISQRQYVPPTFNEIRHILNLAQVIGIGPKLKLITFDGDQTLYSDGGNFQNNRELAGAIIDLLIAGVTVSIVTAAGYGLDGPKYEVRLDGLLRALENADVDDATASRLLLLGGECNYLLRCEMRAPAPDSATGKRTAHLVAVPNEEWQAAHIDGPKPVTWPEDVVQSMLDIAQKVMDECLVKLKLRARLIRKPRSLGIIPGGDDMVSKVPVGHGSKKLKREALDEITLRCMDALRANNCSLPYCAFNGGRDAWVDVGDKSVGVAALQAWLGIDNDSCIHVGDQFLNVGNDISARTVCPCLWIVNPNETAKMLLHVLDYAKIEKKHRFGLDEDLGDEAAGGIDRTGTGPKMNIYTGEVISK